MMTQRHSAFPLQTVQTNIEDCSEVPFYARSAETTQALNSQSRECKRVPCCNQRPTANYIFKQADEFMKLEPIKHNMILSLFTCQH